MATAMARPRLKRRPVMDLQESFAVPPEDPKGSIRVGWFVAGGLLIALGWGLGIVANLVLHRLAPAGGLVIGSVRIFPALGPYAWAAFGFGAFTGMMGLAIVLLGRTAPKGPIVVPGFPY